MLQTTSHSALKLTRRHCFVLRPMESCLSLVRCSIMDATMIIYRATLSSDYSRNRVVLIVFLRGVALLCNVPGTERSSPSRKLLRARQFLSIGSAVVSGSKCLIFRDHGQNDLVDSALSFGGMMLLGGWALLGFDPVSIEMPGEECAKTGRCAPQ
jgi:uncharacterized membrane protein YgdD (TMEM256/DUF423 family)